MITQVLHTVHIAKGPISFGMARRQKGSNGIGAVCARIVDARFFWTKRTLANPSR